LLPQSDDFVMSLIKFSDSCEKGDCFGIANTGLNIYGPCVLAII